VSDGSPKPEPPLRALELLAVLRAHGVEFVVIGGFSLAAHGFVRGTKDLDIVPEPSLENLQRLLFSLEDLEAEPLAVGEFKPEELPLQLGLDGLSEGGNWLLRTRLGRLDVMQHVHGMSSYEQLRAGAMTPDLAELNDPPPFAGYDDLIAMKQATGRAQDLIDITELERARGASS
jgi:hypothetical protein